VSVLDAFAANAAFLAHAEAVGADIKVSLLAWAKLFDACGRGAPPTPAERLAATLGTRAAQESIRALADALEPLALRYDALCGAAAGETAQ